MESEKEIKFKIKPEILNNYVDSINSIKFPMSELKEKLKKISMPMQGISEAINESMKPIKAVSEAMAKSIEPIREQLKSINVMSDEKNCR